MRMRDKHHNGGDSAISCSASSYVSLVCIGCIYTRCNNTITAVNTRRNNINNSEIKMGIPACGRAYVWYIPR